MLRVYSILYLEQVWSRPLEMAKAGTIDQDSSAVAAVPPEEATSTNEVEAVSSYGNLSTANLASFTHQEDQEETTAVDQTFIDQEQQNDEEEEEEAAVVGSSTVTPSGTMGELSSSNSSIRTTSDGGKANSLLVNVVAPRSETPLTQHYEKEFVSSPVSFATAAKKIINGREFYDDDVDIDEEDDDEFIVSPPAPTQELPTPPSTPITPSKFSPKRILHRAKSTINDESAVAAVRNLGRRTSLFLEKLNHHNSNQSAPPLPSSPTSITKNSGNNSSSANSLNDKEDNKITKGLRRRSSKLTVKGKTFTRKIRKVLSFHQSLQQQPQQV